MSDNVAIENPEVNFVRPCNLCPHMKRITLPGILRSLQSMTHAVCVPDDVMEKARAAVQRMIDLPLQGGRAGYTREYAPEIVALERRA